MKRRQNKRVEGLGFISREGRGKEESYWVLCEEKAKQKGTSIGFHEYTRKRKEKKNLV